jgi:hypothetical protein
MNMEVAYLDEHDVVRVCWHGAFSGPRDASAMMTQARPVLEEHSCTRILYDLRDAPIVDSAMETYDTGNRAIELGFSRELKAAVLYSLDEKKHRFVETVMVNRGYKIRVFQDESVAIDWLTGQGDSQQRFTGDAVDRA